MYRLRRIQHGRWAEIVNRRHSCDFGGSTEANGKVKLFLGLTKEHFNYFTLILKTARLEVETDGNVD